MKLKIISTIVITLLTFSQLGLAGTYTIPKTYVTGDTLTAADLNNENTAIQTAVNDNNNASRFYGDGSAGALTVSSNTSWSSSPPTGDNLNFTDIVINAGFTLTVPAGTVIRCTGSFTNNGTINVLQAVNGGRYFYYDTTTVAMQQFQAPGAGDSLQAAGNPGWHHTTSVGLRGGFGGKGIPRTMAASSFNQFRIGGGGGAGNAYNNSGDGGGLIKIYCAGNVVNNGTIQANGSNNLAGAGGGGIVILASSTQVTNDAAATITADGADGYQSTTFNGANGGGGGGIIIMAAPSVTNAGATSVAGGAAGDNTTNVTSAVHTGGSGGGACGGNGGNGASVTTGNLSNAAGSGTVGYVIEINADPADMM